MTDSPVSKWRRLCLGGIAGLVLAACSSPPPAPDWQLNAHGAALKGVEAYLSGQTRVATLEFARAHQETARTGQPALLGRIVLLECAARVASLDFSPCSGFDALREDAGVVERAYADYLAGRLSIRDAHLLPAAQRPVAAVPAGGAMPLLAEMSDPLSRLVAAGVLFRTGRADPGTLQLAVDTASQRGWRRPLIAWLLLQARSAEEAGNAQEAARLRRRVGLVEQGGALP